MISIALIPARYASTRLPAKLMLDLGGAPVIVRTYQAVKATGLFDQVYVVTDHEAIAQAIQEAGGEVLISTQPYACGSDRIAAALANCRAATAGDAWRHRDRAAALERVHSGLVIDWCEVLQQAGFTERSVGVLQAMVESHLPICAQEPAIANMRTR